MERNPGEPEPGRLRKVQDVKGSSKNLSEADKRYVALAFIVWAILLMVLSFQSMKTVSTPRFAASDKLMHAAFYFPLGAVLFWNFYRDKKGAAIIKAAALAGAYGLMIELIQGALPWRNFELYDALANLSGAGGGALLAAAFPRLPYLELLPPFHKTRTENQES
ncbi:MAG: VanZ family protein [bacterium]